MKFNKLFVAALGTIVVFGSCSYQTGVDRQRQYANATLADGDAFQLIKYVTENGTYLVNLAKYSETASGSSKVKALSAKIQEVYGKVLPELDALGIDLHVGDGNRGVPRFTVPTAIAADSTKAFNEAAFLALVAQKQQEINLKVSHEEHNTNPQIIHFSEESIEGLQEIYKLAGGKEEAHGHH